MTATEYIAAHPLPTAASCYTPAVRGLAADLIATLPAGLPHLVEGQARYLRAIASAPDAEIEALPLELSGVATEQEARRTVLARFARLLLLEADTPEPHPYYARTFSSRVGWTVESGLPLAYGTYRHERCVDPARYLDIAPRYVRALRAAGEEEAGIRGFLLTLLADEVMRRAG